MAFSTAIGIDIIAIIGIAGIVLRDGLLVLENDYIFCR